MNKKEKYCTDFLTANSFVIGMGSIFNLSGNYFIYNSSETEGEADTKAIASDWNIVGQDINNAIGAFNKENEKQEQLVIQFTD